MKLNLGCGNDLKEGYLNVDERNVLPHGKSADFMQLDLSKFPWPWKDSSVDEILMLDFLEHFPYSKTENVLREAWRVLKLDFKIVIQVPDFDHCSKVITHTTPFMCNVCGWEYGKTLKTIRQEYCERCGQRWIDCAFSAMKRLYGGQDYQGNFHYTSFTETLLKHTLKTNGFSNFVTFEKNENGETFWQNWSIKLEATKISDLWGEE